MPKAALLECGSNSLKVHFRAHDSAESRTKKLPWRLGRDVYETGNASPGTLETIVGAISELARDGFQRDSLLAIATEWLREAGNKTDVLGQLRDRAGLYVRILSGREEGSLLAEGYLRAGGGIPATLLDLGGGSAQLVHLSEEKTVLRDSLPLGAIRLFCLGREEGKPWNRRFVEEHIDSVLETAAIVPSPRLVATGGTVKALCKLLGKTLVDPGTVDALIERISREGPPSSLSPERREVFLPGLIVLSKILRALGASELSYQPIPVGRIFFERLMEKTGGRLAEGWRDAILESLKVTTVIRRK